ncbi:hypothetical protein FBF91_08030 [Campylobacter upsaliensis]|uniref:hypothetical protein n=1 Tax=Campylobacter upsaliensis TaxID=28080 RepID=UPI0012C67A74|nr:hypothetical protein [Campylobacter upsaliensis]EAK7296945.1 hypothetical protein [Campylobacter upsaliensis]MBJ6809618.1 hypothetical protein [Campylobacter upsaliensis]
MKIILIDADSLLFRASYKSENLDEAIDKYIAFIKYIKDECKSDKCKMFFKGKSNFRYALFEDYKKKRHEQLAMPGLELINPLKDYLFNTYGNCIAGENWEADDAIISLYNEKEHIIAALDKDVLGSATGLHFNYGKGIFIETLAEYTRKWPYLQCLAGDATDGIPGCPGVGLKTAFKILGSEQDEKKLWNLVVQAYKLRGLDENYAILMMRLVNLHQVKNNEKLILWEPT